MKTAVNKKSNPSKVYRYTAGLVDFQLGIGFGEKIKGFLCYSIIGVAELKYESGCRDEEKLR